MIFPSFYQNLIIKRILIVSSTLDLFLARFLLDGEANFVPDGEVSIEPSSNSSKAWDDEAILIAKRQSYTST